MVAAQTEDSGLAQAFLYVAEMLDLHRSEIKCSASMHEIIPFK